MVTATKATEPLPAEIAGLRTEPKWQFFPAMHPSDYARLKEDIHKQGFLPDQAVVIDEEGRILDGHHRAKACAELGMACPTRTVTGMTESDKERYVWSVNLFRRHIPAAERMTLVRRRMAMAPEMSDRAIARELGVSPTSVGTVREELEESVQIGHFEPDPGRGKTTRAPVDWQSWPRCEVCDKPVKPGNVHEGDDGRQGHRACLEPGVGADLPEHRGLVVAWLSLEYSVPNEEDIHNRAGLPYPREAERREWESGPMPLTCSSPQTGEEAANMIFELERSIARRLEQKPLVTMVG